MRTRWRPALIPVLILQSCATIFSSSRFPVPIRSEPSHAQVTITDRKGNTVFEGETPAMADLRSSNGYFRRGIYRVRVTKEGHEPHEEVIRARICGWYWANVLIGGALGMLLIDPATGAMYSLNNRFVFAKLYLIMSSTDRSEERSPAPVPRSSGP